jgi:low affinity Fe/Cu permease
MMSETPELPQQSGSLLREFMDFIVHNKAWWMTPIILVLLAMIAFILWAESSPVLPFIYTVI